MSPVQTVILGFLVFFGLLALRMPVAFIMALVGFLGLSYLISPEAAFVVVAKDLHSTFASYSFSVVPMFVWMGYIALYSGISKELYGFAYELLGAVRGGLAMAVQLSCAGFGAICGSPTATIGTIGAVAFPELQRRNYEVNLSAAGIAAGGTLGVLIPPSVVLIVYGVATGQSIGKLFIAGILPGILLMLCHMGAIYICALRNPNSAPPAPIGSKRTRKEIMSEFGGAIQTIIIFALVLGGLFAGWFTPTEAGAVGATALLAVCLIFRRRLTWQGIKNSLLDTTRVTAMVMFLLAGATILGRFIVVCGIPSEIASWVSELHLPPFIILAFVLITYIFFGFFIEALSLLLITIPVFYPLVVTSLGYDPIWFGLILVVVGGIGAITPPVGLQTYIASGVTNVPTAGVFRGIWPFFFAEVICVALLMAFPQIITFLPSVAAY
jgi:tripartite ATP-independent transporter DctM subunit